jgi:hypothetical protein
MIKSMLQQPPPARLTAMQSMSASMLCHSLQLLYAALPSMARLPSSSTAAVADEVRSAVLQQRASYSIGILLSWLQQQRPEQLYRSWQPGPSEPSDGDVLLDTYEIGLGCLMKLTLFGVEGSGSTAATVGVALTEQLEQSGEQQRSALMCISN